VADDTQSAGDDLLQMAVVAYREGEVGILELLDAGRVSTRARMRTLELQRDARLAEIALERAVGEVLWP
jgi:outer membrane protein TolC